MQDRALWTLTTMVQIGFIIGTLIFAFLTIADRFSPSKVFFVSALLGAVVNAGILWEGNTLISLMIFRFLTGLFLAGIYPVGMKIASDYYKNGLGKALGFLVGALVLGTALPHLLKGLASDLPWRYVIITISTLSIIGGTAIVSLCPNGPYRKKGTKIRIHHLREIFKNRELRVAASGYYGHMWELYTFWVFVPLIITAFVQKNQYLDFDVPFWSFIIIASGSIGCILAGCLCTIIGTKRIAFLFLTLSMSCCLISPFLMETQSVALFIIFMLFWGITVIGDSPLFSSLVANNVAPEFKGTAITLVTSIGFAITIVSIELVGSLATRFDLKYILLALSIGPLISLVIYFKDAKKETNSKSTN